MYIKALSYYTENKQNLSPASRHHRVYKCFLFCCMCCVCVLKPPNVLNPRMIFFLSQIFLNHNQNIPLTISWRQSGSKTEILNTTIIMRVYLEESHQTFLDAKHIENHFATREEKISLLQVDFLTKTFSRQALRHVNDNGVATFEMFWFL